MLLNLKKLYYVVLINTLIVAFNITHASEPECISNETWKTIQSRVFAIFREKRWGSFKKTLTFRTGSDSCSVIHTFNIKKESPAVSIGRILALAQQHFPEATDISCSITLNTDVNKHTLTITFPGKSLTSTPQ